jgi:hypothetical protein
VVRAARGVGGGRLADRRRRAAAAARASAGATSSAAPGSGVVVTRTLLLFGAKSLICALLPVPTRGHRFAVYAPGARPREGSSAAATSTVSSAPRKRTAPTGSVDTAPDTRSRTVDAPSGLTITTASNSTPGASAGKPAEPWPRSTPHTNSAPGVCPTAPAERLNSWNVSLPFHVKSTCVMSTSAFRGPV